MAPIAITSLSLVCAACAQRSHARIQRTHVSTHTDMGTLLKMGVSTRTPAHLDVCATPLATYPQHVHNADLFVDASLQTVLYAEA